MAHTIRPALPSDTPQILSFIQALAEYERLSADVTATEEKLAATLFGAKPAAECILAFAGEIPAGFAIYFTNYSTFLATPGLYLEDLFVKPDFRGLGIGKSLLTHLAKLAADRGYGRMEWTVLDWNQSAIDFYEGLGARRMPGWNLCRLTGESLTRYGSPAPR